MPHALPSPRDENDAGIRHPVGLGIPSGRLKICFISETLHAGVGRHIVDAICALSERGHEIHLLYSPIRMEAQFLATIQQQKNVHCEAVTMPRAIGRDDVSAFIHIRTYVRIHGPFDIIHGHSSKGGGYARLLRFSAAGAIVYTPHAFSTLSPVTGTAKRLTYGMIEAALARLTSGIICTSRAERDHARRLGIQANRLAIIAHGLEPATGPRRETIRTLLGIASDQIVVGFVGRMDDQKAPERLIAAARRLLPQLPTLVLVMIGEGPKRAALEDGLQQAGLDHRVRWLGAVEARQYMPAFDIFVLPSLYEGFAYVLIEALYAGLAIISTPVGGTAEAVMPGLNGMIVPHGATDALAEAIRQLATDHALRRAMGKASRALAEQFSIPCMADAIEDLYRMVLSGRRPLRRPAPLGPIGLDAG